jgi:hypothetical protein
LIESSETEISQLEFPTIIDKDIRTLDIAMNDALVMEICKTRKHLMTQGLQVSIRKGELRLRKYASQIMIHVFKNHKN